VWKKEKNVDVVFAEENQILKDMESMSSNMSSVRVVDPISFGVIGSEVTC
jgi:hypothetical protein